ncbi:alpha-lactalbumin [Meriones unguiculatus]|uniref:alpha-lactalbumin n=1 Tax=Meriones unguiculatus TaxID=10047 RepID=UPI000B4F1A43|nr:alpha-lactalbumin-like [Meriones unguiculatus]XP_021514423.1 alpha-lactalbumin [Meriones unguiculatus]
MTRLVPFFLACLLFPAIQATELTKCEVAHAIKDIDGHQGVSLLEWICILFHTSGYDTEAVLKNEDATEYGLFQISNKFWCKSSEIPESQNICGISCDKFLNDDLTDDIACVKKILALKGIDNWPAHKPMCSQELEQWRCRKV